MPRINFFCTPEYLSFFYQVLDTVFLYNANLVQHTRCASVKRTAPAELLPNFIAGAYTYPVVYAASASSYLVCIGNIFGQTV